MPKISVIVPNYNRARCLRRRVDTILAQTIQDFELILLDDCSTDESQAILRQYSSNPRVRLDINEFNSSSTFKQWNKGVRLARDKYVWSAESDDYADDRLLGRLVGVLEADEKVTYICCCSWRVTEDDRLDGFADSPLNPSDALRWSANYCADGAEECRNYGTRESHRKCERSCFSAGGFQSGGRSDEWLHVAGDWKLWAAMALRGRVAYVSEPLNYYRLHADGVRSKTLGGGPSTAELFHAVHWLMDQVEPADSVSACADGGFRP
jgi:glycosyltransferase involved in cell wall biosynthesis